MIIAVPTEQKSMAADVSTVFGRAKHYLVFDSDSEERFFIDNQALDSPGGAGVKAAQQLLDNDVQVVLAPRCGGNAERVLKQARVELYRTVSASLQDNIKAYNRGDLPRLDPERT